MTNPHRSLVNFPWLVLLPALMLTGIGLLGIYSAMLEGDDNSEAVTTVAILLRKYMKKRWRAVHRLNYAVFAVALVHAFQVGTDVAAVAFLEVMLYIYAALAAAGFVYRIQLEIRNRLRKRSSKGTAGVGLPGD